MGLLWVRSPGHCSSHLHLHRKIQVSQIREVQLLGSGPGHPRICVVTSGLNKGHKICESRFRQPQGQLLCSPALAASARASLQFSSPRSQGGHLSEYQGISVPMVFTAPREKLPDSQNPSHNWRGKDLRSPHEHHLGLLREPNRALGESALWARSTRMLPSNQNYFTLLPVKFVFGCFGWSTVQRTRWGFGCFMNRII